jgi:hypothetical protein
VQKHTSTENHVDAKGISGQFEESVYVDGINITVRGMVIDGVVKIGTAFIP